MKELAKWIGVLTVIIILGYGLQWNEFESPWGRANQAAKVELLKARICN